MKIAIDLGGTNIRAAQVENGLLLKKTSVSCPAQQDAATVLNQLSLLVRDLMNEKVEGIGVGVPSIVDTQRGIVYDVANIASWKEVQLKDILEKEFKVPVAINNDCNCFTLGENRYGRGKAFNNMVGVTLGTGIGAGIIVNKQLYCGEYAGAGEIGTLPYLDSDFEHYCSSFLFKRYNTTGLETVTRATAGDEKACGILDEFGMHLGNMMKAIMFCYAPQAVVLGGGIARAFPFFNKAMYKAMNDFPYSIILKQVQIYVSCLEDAGLLGASTLL